MSEHICNICNQKFDSHSLKANHIRWKHKSDEFKQQYIEKDRIQKIRNDEIRLGEFKDFDVICEKCGQHFTVNERELKFPIRKKYYCSLSCSNSNSHTDETKEKIRIGVKELWKNEDYAKKHRQIINTNKRSSSKGEREIRQILKERYGNKEVSSHRIVKFENINKSVDLTIKSKNIIIEYDGIWHFDSEIYERFGTPEKYLEVVNKDKLLKEYCENNNIRLLRVSDKYYLHNKRKTISEIFEYIEKSDLCYKELY